MTHPHRAGVRDAGRLIACATAIFCVGAAFIHLSAAADHTNLPVMAVGFVLLAAVQGAIGALLVSRRPSRLVLAGAVAVMVSSVGIWVLSRTAGLPFLEGGHVEPIGFKDATTVLFELAAVPGLLMLMSSGLSGLSLPSARLGTQTLTALGAAVFVLMVPALVLAGGGHHSADQLAHADGGHGPGSGDVEHAGATGHGHRGGGGPTAAADEGAHGHGDGDGAHGGDGHDGSARLVSALQDGGHGHGDAGQLGLPVSAGGDGGHGHGGSPAGQHETGDGGHPREPERGEQHAGGGHGDAPAAGHGEGADHATEPAGHDAGGGHGDDGHDDAPERDSYAFTYEPDSDGTGRGGSFVFKDSRREGDPIQSALESESHHSSAPCNPTAEQQTNADALYRATSAALQPFHNNPARAIAEGFTIVVPTDRYIHMINPDRMFNPDVLVPNEIEAFMYMQTDRGLAAIGGMYMMPGADDRGPQIGGCLTQWHRHGGFLALATGLQTRDFKRTQEMLHVWTYPGLNPWGHYSAEDLAKLWAPGRAIPLLCYEPKGYARTCM